MSLQNAPKWAERPLGMRDVYPQQARLRRQVENRLLEFFEAEGFEMVSCGVFEYVDTLLRGRSREEPASWVQLFDTSGRAMALRPDITPSIARMGAPLLHGGGDEIRWCYAERVYRRANESSSFTWSGARAAESTQVGVEWLGSGSDAMDALETDAALLRLCADAMRHLGLRNWQLVVGHAGFTPAFLEAIGIATDNVDDLLTNLAQGNYVGFQQDVRQDVQQNQNILDELTRLNPYRPDSLAPEIRKKFSESEAGTRALQAWERLVQLAANLKTRGIEDAVSFDLTLCRDLTYYTGIVFEVFAEGVGAPVALGGRYDDLLRHFGATAPAIGFTFEIDGLMNVATQSQHAATLSNDPLVRPDGNEPMHREEGW